MRSHLLGQAGVKLFVFLALLVLVVSALGAEESKRSLTGPLLVRVMEDGKTVGFVTLTPPCEVELVREEKDYVVLQSGAIYGRALPGDFRAATATPAGSRNDVVRFRAEVAWFQRWERENPSKRRPDDPPTLPADTAAADKILAGMVAWVEREFQWKQPIIDVDDAREMVGVVAFSDYFNGAVRSGKLGDDALTHVFTLLADSPAQNGIDVVDFSQRRPIEWTIYCWAVLDLADEIIKRGIEDKVSYAGAKPSLFR